MPAIERYRAGDSNINREMALHGAVEACNGDAKMKKPLTMLVAVVLWQSAPALARDIIDVKTHEYTPYGLAVSVIAGAQVSDMKCATKGQTDLALAKANRSGVSIDLADKEDFSAVLFQASKILNRLEVDGASAWCAANAAKLEQYLKEP
jgi:hypothetical protein